jgi:putative glutamine amidotransferase
VQHINSGANHNTGAKVEVAHKIAVAATSLLADQILSGQQTASVAVNSSHHQSADIIGDGLRPVAHCAEDGIIEAIEGTVPGHYVLAVQWHPERTFERDPSSRRLFQAFVDSARQWSDRKA